MAASVLVRVRIGAAETLSIQDDATELKGLPETPLSWNENRSHPQSTNKFQSVVRIDLSQTGDLVDIQQYCFAFLAGLKDIKLNPKTRSIGDGAFYRCSSLGGIDLPDTVASIGSNAFHYCSSLKSFRIPRSLTDCCTFVGCSSLASFHVPDSVTSIRRQQFAGLTSLKHVRLSRELTSIGDGAFLNCAGLTRILVPTGVTRIGNTAFRGCLSLTIFRIPDGVKSIEGYTFEDCSSLVHIDIPSSVTSIGWGAFLRCSSMTSIRLPDGVTSIGDCAFKGTSLTSVHLPGKLTSIGAESFDGCALDVIVLGGRGLLEAPIQIPEAKRLVAVWADGGRMKRGVLNRQKIERVSKAEAERLVEAQLQRLLIDSAEETERERIRIADEMEAQRRELAAQRERMAEEVEQLREEVRQSTSMVRGSVSDDSGVVLTYDSLESRSSFPSPRSTIELSADEGVRLEIGSPNVTEVLFERGPEPEEQVQEEQSPAAPSAKVVSWNSFEAAGSLPAGGQSVEVLKLREIETGRIVVAKLVSLRSAVARRFHREVEMLLRFGDVPQIIPFIGVSYPPDKRDMAAIITGFAEGGSLADALKRKELSGQQLSNILIDVLLGLRALHSAGVIHQDIKPSNVLLDKTRNHAFLCDFGASRLELEGVTQSVMVTEAYVAEEARSGMAVLASDVFSFGVVLREAVTGCPSKKDERAWVAVRDGKFDVSAIGNAAVASLILSCVRRDPVSRPTADAVLERLKSIGPSLLERTIHGIRKIRFHEEDDPTICSFTAKLTDTLGSAMNAAGLDGRLYFDGDAIAMRTRVSGLDPEVVYVLR